MYSRRCAALLVFKLSMAPGVAMKRVLVTFAGGRLALGISRALRAAPEPVHLIGVDSAPYHLHQAEADELHLVPRATEPDYINVLCDVAMESKADFIWPMHDAEVERVSEAANSLPARTWLPPASVVRLCQDKMASSLRMKQAGVPVPEGVFIETPEDLEKAFDVCGGEIWLRANSGTGGAGALRTSDIGQAVMWLDLHSGWHRFMAAEVLPGPNDLSWEAVWKDGKLIAAQAKTRLVRGNTGISISGVMGRAVIQHDAPPEVREVASRAVRALVPEPDGIFRVDMMADADGTPNVTEVDAGRFGSTGVSYWHRFGFNFPYQALRIGFGEPIDYETPVIDPAPKDIIAIAGVNRNMEFVKLSDVESGETKFRERRSRLQRG